MRVTPATFRAEIEAAGLTQARLARLLDLNPITVNRWCRQRADAVAVPQYARAFVATWAQLTAAERGSLEHAIGRWSQLATRQEQR